MDCFILRTINTQYIETNVPCVICNCFSRKFNFPNVFFTFSSTYFGIVIYLQPFYSVLVSCSSRF